ncbi:MAG: T9SS type A sorting domain-containing protein [Bacteroidota bacterium]
MQQRATDYTKDIVVYPNPTSVYLNIAIHSSESSLYQIAIIDILGKTHIAQTVHVSEGLNHITIYVDNLPKGVYQVELINASEVSLKSFIKN